MTETSYEVQGMTCGHCVSAVEAELGKLAGVTDVDVDLTTGLVTVTSATTLLPEQVRAAVVEAGYELAT